MGHGMVGRTALACTVVLSLFAWAHAEAAACATPPARLSAIGSQSAGTPAVNPDAKALVSLQNRIKEYLKLHNKLEATLPSLPKEASPQQIDVHQRSLAKLVQEARKDAKPHDLFTPESRRVILKLMKQIFGGPDGRQLRDSIMDENPGNLRIVVNERYPDIVPLSTVPPQVLAGLPKLPDELEFRFIGRSLILMDVHAHIIVDFVENAIPA